MKTRQTSSDSFDYGVGARGLGEEARVSLFHSHAPCTNFM